MHLGQNVSARGEPKSDNLLYDSARSLCIRKCAERDESFHSLRRSERLAPLHRLGATDRLGPANPPATDDDVAGVNDGRLPRRDGALRFVQANACAMVLNRRHGGAGAGMTVANLDRPIA